MEASTRRQQHDQRRQIAAPRLALVVALAVAASVPLPGCSTPAEPATPLADWCWTHYRLAPGGSLALDGGPSTPDEAAAWSTWLEATSPPPDARRVAHLRQIELVQRFRTAGGWTESERDEYLDAATSDPTPATACEAVGARIIPSADGSLPAGWERRFVDEADPARSGAARREADVS